MSINRSAVARGDSKSGAGGMWRGRALMLLSHRAGWVKMDLKAGEGKRVILNPDTD